MKNSKYVPCKCRRDFGIQAATELLLPIRCFTTDGIILEVPGLEYQSYVEAFLDRVAELRENKTARWTLSKLMERERIRRGIALAESRHEKNQPDPYLS